MKLLRNRDVQAITGLSRATIWRLEVAGQFPPHYQVAPNCQRWREDDVMAWVDKVTGRSESGLAAKLLQK